MGGFEYKRAADGSYIRVPRDRGQRVVTLEAAQVRGCHWKVQSAPKRGRMASFDDGRHQVATGAGRTTPRRGGSSDSR